MLQQFNMIAPARQEKLLSWEFIPELVFGDRVTGKLISRLAVPAPSGIPPDSVEYQATENMHSDVLLLKVLPLEILLMVMDQLDNSSIHRLSMCCKSLRLILRPEVHMRFRRSLAPWSKTPLIFAGASMTDIPESVRIVMPNQAPATCSMNWDTFHGLLKPTTIMWSYYFPAPRLHSLDVISPAWNKLFELEHYFPTGRHWVLRNHTKQIYVYAHILTSRFGQGGGEDKPNAEHQRGYGLGTLVAVKTRWTDHPQPYMGMDMRGEWAGDCFDIVVGETLEEGIARGEVWDDHSFLAWQEMDNLYRVCATALGF